MRNCVYTSLCIVLLAISTISFADPSMPWELRNHYSFNAKNSTLDYAEDNGAWRVRLKDKLLIKEAQFDITLGDGTVIHSRDLGTGASSRDVSTAFLGQGFQYSVTFNDLNGLKVMHDARTIEGRPFILLEITIENKTDKPIVLKNVRPVIIEEGAIMNFGANALYRNRHLTTQGGMAVFDKGNAPSMSIFHDPELNASIGIYLFDKGQSDASIRFQPANGSWAGDVICSYEPGKVIRPGEKLTTDPVVVIFGYPTPNKMELFTSWAYGTFMARKDVKEAPRAMASAPEGASLDAVSSTGRAMKGDGVTHALIPFGWEETPGSLRGGNGYPKNIGGAAASLSREGLSPGLTIDPLPVEKCKEGCVEDTEGISWANPATPEGRNATLKRFRSAIGSDFSFIALAPSRIPDAVLTQFGISRAEANNLAFDIAVELYKNLPVIPAGGQAIPPTLDAILEASSAAGRLGVYGGRFAPLRINLDADSGPVDNLGLALKLWPGPIAFEGNAKGGVQHALAEGISPLGYAVSAVDLHHTVSHVWQVMPDTALSNPTPFGAAITIFPGANFWHTEDVDVENPGEMRLWNPGNGQFLNGDSATAQSPATLTTLGAMPISDHPAMMGVSGSASLSLDRLQNHVWNTSTATLSGGFKGGVSGSGKAFVHVPAPWKFKSGEAGKSKVRGSAEGEILSFSMSGSSSQFELKFEK